MGSEYDKGHDAPPSEGCRYCGTGDGLCDDCAEHVQAEQKVAEAMARDFRHALEAITRPVTIHPAQWRKAGGM